MISGIYQIKNTLNGKCYIGSAVNLKKRWGEHLRALRRGGHANLHLQRAFDKDGEETFLFEILEYIEDSKQLILHEQHYFDTMNPEYNFAPTAGSRLGIRCTEETLAKMSASQSGERNPNYGKHFSAEARANMRAAQMGHQVSAETRAKIGAAKIGKHRSEETLAKMSIAMTGERNPNYGKSPSAEIRAKQSKAMIGRHPSEETLAKMSVAKTGERNPNYGKRHSAETLAKMSASQSGERNPNYGKHRGEETKRKISETLKAYWRRKRVEDQ